MTSDDVPEDVVIQILLCLPVMSLMRFKCVCKSWCALIQSPSFISRHLYSSSSSSSSNTNTNNNNLLVKRHLDVKDNYDFFLLSGETQTLEVSLNLHAPSSFKCIPYLQMVGACNGIICLDDKFGGDGDLLALWNPATREFRALPKSRIPPAPGTKFREFEVGFGFDHKTNDYKVVRIVYSLTENFQRLETHQVEVYSLKANSWRLIDAAMPAPSLWLRGNYRTYLNGIYSWWTIKDILVSFDMSNEVFLETPLPESCRYGLYDGYWKCFMVLNESIAFIYFSTGFNFMEDWFELWVLNEYGVNGSWTKLYRVDHPFSAFGLLFPIGFSKNGELFLEEAPEETEGPPRLLTNRRRLLLFDPLTQEIKNLHVDAVTQSLQIIVYRESLVSIKGGSDPFLN